MSAVRSRHRPPICRFLEKAMSKIETFGEWKFTIDREATLRAYAQAKAGGADSCSCNGCRNFRLARERAFPRDFLLLLERLGIDPCKDGEVYLLGRDGPGGQPYGGWFHFVGELHVTGDFPVIQLGDGFTAWMCKAGAPRLDPLEYLPCVQLEFFAEAVPWLLDEPEPG
jgi:hypothetical protein